VLTLIRPDVAVGGTVVDKCVEVALASDKKVALSFAALFDRTVSKLVPSISKVVGDAPAAGVKAVIVGAPVEVTMNGALVVVDPPDPVLVTPIGPVVAVAGTVVTILVDVDDVTIAVTPLNVTVFDAGVVLKPVP
jgi:hypothetical protein